MFAKAMDQRGVGQLHLGCSKGPQRELRATASVLQGKTELGLSAWREGGSCPCVNVLGGVVRELGSAQTCSAPGQRGTNRKLQLNTLLLEEWSNREAVQSLSLKMFKAAALSNSLEAALPWLMADVSSATLWRQCSFQTLSDWTARSCSPSCTTNLSVQISAHTERIWDTEEDENW